MIFTLAFICKLVLSAPIASQTVDPVFTVGTTDTLRLSHWLLERGWTHRNLGQGLFEVQIHFDSMEKLSTVPGINRIEAPAQQNHHSLDGSRARIEADPVHLGKGLSRPYHGSGVLVGIIDVGFDLKHYSFLDANGNSRIIRLWDQTNRTGTPPAGYQTGTLFSGAKLAAEQRSGSFSHHGTHVAGLAAGRTWVGSGGEWWGTADNAKIALVECGNGCPQIGNGMEYLFKLADSLGLPAVVNMSWGTLNGPRDGRSSDCLRGAALLGPGKLAVVSAGNSGRDFGHAVHKFLGDTARLALEVSAGIQTRGEDTIRQVFFNEAELWGDSAQSYRVWVEFIDSATGKLLSQSKRYDNPIPWGVISEETIVGIDTFWVSGNLETRSEQGGIRLSISTSRPHTSMRVGIYSATAEVHAWIWEEGLEFKTESAAKCPTCLVPDREQMISDKATCPEFISVGAIDGQDGSAADFTSKGPGRGRIPKPDISAPGVGIVSSLNSWVNDGTPIMGSAGTSYWGQMSGTSMSAPLVTGTLALMLEANPKLDPTQALAALRGAAKTHNAATGWRELNVLDLFTESQMVATNLVTNKNRTTGTVSLAWITPHGVKIQIPQGIRAMDVHPKGVAWLQTCVSGNCTVQAVVRP